MAQTGNTYEKWLKVDNTATMCFPFGVLDTV